MHCEPQSYIMQIEDSLYVSTTLGLMSTFLNQFDAEPTRLDGYSYSHSSCIKWRMITAPQPIRTTWDIMYFHSYNTEFLTKLWLFWSSIGYDDKDTWYILSVNWNLASQWNYWKKWKMTKRYKDELKRPRKAINTFWQYCHYIIKSLLCYIVFYFENRDY